MVETTEERFFLGVDIHAMDAVKDSKLHIHVHMFKDLREPTVQKSKCHYIFHSTQQGIRQHTVYPVLYLKNLLHAVTARAVYVFTCVYKCS